MAKLGVNIDHVATLREARKTIYPDPVTAAVMAEIAGADNITCHLREDRRHVQERDVRLLREMVGTSLNLEMAMTQEMVGIALEVKPNVVTMVPERREELTTEGGLDLSQRSEALSKNISLLREGGISVSLFIDPNIEAIKSAHRSGAQAVEFHTGRYADALREVDRGRELDRIREAISLAAKLKMEIHVGHGLHYQNVQPLVDIAEIESFQIGHAIIARSIFVGMDRAVQEMKSLLI